MNITDLDYQKKVDMHKETVAGGRRIQISATAVAVGNIKAITFVRTLAGSFSIRF